MPGNSAGPEPGNLAAAGFISNPDFQAALIVTDGFHVNPSGGLPSDPQPQIGNLGAGGAVQLDLGQL